MEKYINAQFFEKIIRKYEGDDTIKIMSLDTSPGCKKGQNFMTFVRRITVTGTKIVNGKTVDYSNSYITKQIPENEDHVSVYRVREAFKNEAKAYNEIIPALKKYSVGGKLSVLDAVHADDHFIVLPDLARQGFHNVKKSDHGFTIEQSVPVLQELAKLHAASFVMKKKNPASFKPLTHSTDMLFDAPAGNSWSSIQSLYMKTALAIVNDLDKPLQYKKEIEMLQGYKDDIFQRQKNVFKVTKNLAVINHGECWANNILLLDNEVKLIDLQLMRNASVAADLSYFLYINLQPAQRIENFEKLLQVYLVALKKNIKNQGVDMEDVLTMDWLTSEMKQFAIFGFMSALWITPVFYFEDEDLDPVNVARNIGKSDVAILKSKLSTEHKQRIIELVTDFAKSM